MTPDPLTPSPDSPTPRTDAIIAQELSHFTKVLALAELSESLERENAALVKEREELKEALQEVSRSKVAGDQLIAKYLEEIEDLKAEVQRDREITGLNEAWDNALTLSRTLGTELETLRAQLAETQHARDVASNAASRFKQAYEEANAKLADAKEALEAFSVFVTPLALSRKPDRQWDEFEFDAIKRRNAILTPA